jgi:MerR family transcriptional regulator, mercuric resistance operon regulatory protein
LDFEEAHALASDGVRGYVAIRSRYGIKEKMMRASRGLTIGRLAALSGVNLETIRYYERIGLMPAPDRTEGGHRLYAAAHKRRLSFIRRGRELGFGIGAIRTLLDLAEPGHRSCDDVQPIAASHLQEVRAKIADLARLEAILAQTVSRCEGHMSSPSCPVLEMLEAL